MGATWMIMAVMTGCGETPAPAEPAPAPAEAAPEAPAPQAPATEIPERGDDAERASKNGKLVFEVGGNEIDVRFGRPEMRGREIFGSLIPYDQLWRTGADEATTFATKADLMVNGDHLAAGVYSLFTIPGEKQWTVIFNKEPKQWGAYRYDASGDVLRITSVPTTADTVEAFDIQKTDEGMALRWANVSVPVHIQAHGAEAKHDH